MSISRIGICGSHRTGKTTLAKAIAMEWQIPFVQTSTSDVFKQHGLLPSMALDFKKRLWIQHHVIEAAISIWQAEEGAFVTDRTPLDFMAYTLADIQGNTDVDFTKLEAYLTQCFEVAHQFFTKLVVLQPAIPLVYEEGKAALNRAYIEHLNTLIIGLCHDERLTCPSIVIRRDVVNLGERVKILY
jgi:predicted ATPase